jgi:hypothetical protein
MRFMARRLIAIACHGVVVVGLKKAFEVGEVAAHIGNGLRHDDIVVRCWLE